MRICNKDCENCVFDDCINDEMDADDYREAERRDKLCAGKSTASKKGRAHYLKYRDQYLARSRKYYQAHKAEAIQYQKKYYAENRGRVNALKREHAKRNRGMYGQKQRSIRTQRHALGLTQKEAAKILGVSPSAVSQWERGIVPCKVDAVIRKLQEETERCHCK